MFHYTWYAFITADIYYSCYFFWVSLTVIRTQNWLFYPSELDITVQVDEELCGSITNLICRKLEAAAYRRL
jgi:hypothetical protein